MEVQGTYLLKPVTDLPLADNSKPASVLAVQNGEMVQGVKVSGTGDTAGFTLEIDPTEKLGIPVVTDVKIEGGKLAVTTENIYLKANSTPVDTGGGGGGTTPITLNDFNINDFTAADFN